MQKLKQQIIILFVSITLVMFITVSIINTIFDQILIPKASVQGLLLTIALFANFIFTVLIMIFFSLLFCKLITKIINKFAQKQIEEKNLLYSNIVHDLKTPMTSILGFARALKDKKISEDEVDSIIDIIYTKAKRTDELINTLFCYTKLDSESYKFTYSEQDITSLIREIVAESYNEFEERNMVLDLQIPETSILCSIDKIEFRRAITNLIVNAYKHNLPNSKIGIIIIPTSDYVEITIADDGQDITDATAQNIFSPFICGDESRNSKGGSGLGLAITQKIIKKHKGTITINHSVAPYTKGFTVRLPY